MKTVSLKSVLLTCTALGLIGCGDSTTNITQLPTTPAPIDTGHDHDEEVGKGRLAIASADQAEVHIFDLENNELIETLSITNPATSLYASPESRYALAIQKDSGYIEFIDGGLWQEAHGDHFDQHQDEPQVTSFSLQGVKPAHYVPRGEQSALLFDGDKESGDVASLNLLSDESISANKVLASHNFDTYMHGTAEIRGNFVLTTHRDINSEDNLPSQVILLETHGDHFHEEQTFEETCPDLHGSYQNENYIAFACKDGILTIEQQGSTFTASKIAYPEDVPESDRIWTIKGSEHSATMLGLTPRGIFTIDPENQKISRFERTAEENSYFPRYGFDGHHEHLLLLDKNGALNTYSAEENWQLEQSIQVFDALDDEVRPTIIASKAHELIYIIHEQEVTTIDLEEGKVLSHFDLDFTPGGGAWLGLVSEEEHDH